MKTMQKTYKAIELPATQANIVKAMLSLHIVEKPMPKPKPGQLLIKMEYAPINPSDIAFMQGGYGISKPMPAVPGFEGAGRVVATGSLTDGPGYLGRMVCCFSQDESDGTWAEYFVAKKSQVMRLEDNMDPKQAACFFVNPFTAWGLHEMTVFNESKTAIINAAGSQVAAMLVYLLKQDNIKCIGIDRKAGRGALLKARGFDEVLVSTETGFADRLKEVLAVKDSATGFDAVGGELSGLMLNALPAYSNLVVYGGLSGKALEGFDALELIFADKTITGFNLSEYLKHLEDNDIENISEVLSALILEEQFQTRIQLAVPMTEIVKGMRQYLSSMSDGKVLISF